MHMYLEKLATFLSWGWVSCHFISGVSNPVLSLAETLTHIVC